MMPYYACSALGIMVVYGRAGARVSAPVDLLLLLLQQPEFESLRTWTERNVVGCTAAVAAPVPGVLGRAARSTLKQYMYNKSTQRTASVLVI